MRYVDVVGYLENTSCKATDHAIVPGYTLGKDALWRVLGHLANSRHKPMFDFAAIELLVKASLLKW